MNEANMAPQHLPSGQQRSTGAIDLAITLARHKKIVLGLPMLAAIVSAAVSFALPEMYKSSATLLPPQQAQSGAAALLSQLSGASSLAAGVAGIKNPNDLYMGMLNSRTVSDRLIARFNLLKAYDETSQEKARKMLKENTLVSSGKDGMIVIEVEDESPKLAAAIANGYGEELLKLTKTLALTEASQRRVFYEQQLELSKNNLAAAEAKLKGGLDTHGVVSVDGESRAIVETLGRLRAQISAKEIQLNAMRAFVTDSNSEYRRAREELLSLRGELYRLENGSPSGAAQSGAPGKVQGLDNIQTLRDVKYYQMLYELLAKQYEVARLDEAKDAAIIQVLDPAREPERKSRPKRFLIVFLSTMLAFFAAVAYAFTQDARRRMLLTEAGQLRWNELKAHLGRK